VVGKKEKYLLSAQKLIERGQLDKALAEFAKVVEEDPKDTRTWLKMAELHAKQGANAEATAIYLRTGGLYAEQGLAQKAVAVYKNVLKLSPGTVAAHLKLGALFKQLGLVSDALQQLDMAATELQRAGKPAEAVAALRQAVDIQPDNVVLRVKLAESASHAKLTDEAVREFGKAADQLKAQGRADESLRVVERLLFHQPDNFIKARELAEAYIAKGSPRLALPKLQACLNGDPRDPHTLSLLAKALEQLGQIPKAVSVLKEMVRLCDDLGRASERDAAILRGLTLDPNEPELRAVAVRHQLRGTSAAAAEATPPPVISPIRDRSGVGGTFDLSGVVRVSTGASGRVVAPVGVADDGAKTPSVGASSSAGPDIGRILAEADVFVKYGLLERAADHLGRIFDFAPDERVAREKLIAVLQRLGRTQEAARHLEVLTRQTARSSPRGGGGLPDQNLTLASEASRARAPSRTMAGLGSNQGGRISLDQDEDPASNVMTPPLRRIPQPVEEIPAGAESGPTEELHAEDLDAAEEVHEDELHAEELHEDELQEEVSHSGEGLPDDGEIRLNLGMDDQDATSQDTTPPAVARTSIVALPAKSIAGKRHAGHVDRDDRDDGNDPDAGAGAFSDPTATIAMDMDLAMQTFMAARPTPATPAKATPVDEDELAAELEQVTFFIEQSLTDEAHALLRDLEVRFPRHPRLAEKLREVQSLEPQMGDLEPQSLDVQVVSVVSDRSALKSTHIEAPVPSAHAMSKSVGKTVTTPVAPSASAAEPGEAANFLTYADLAVAYKEMGLLDAAIGELKLLAQDPTREVFALTNIGECFEEKGSLTEAVIRYKRALNCAQVTPEESLLLYFLLGGAFEKLGDVGEALYFFEKVAKRDPKFRDVVPKIAELKPRLVKRAR
jgi:pilus assembly protein FimV